MDADIGLRELADAPITLPLINVEDNTITQVKAGRLRPGDIAEAIEHLYQERTERQTTSAVKKGIALESIRDMMARALALIQSQNISPYDVVMSATGRIKLAQLAINRGGERTLTFEKTKDLLAPCDINEFFDTLCHLSGIFNLADRFKKSETPDPLGIPAQTSTDAPSPG